MKREQILAILKQHIYPDPSANVVCDVKEFEEAVDALLQQQKGSDVENNTVRRLPKKASGDLVQALDNAVIALQGLLEHPGDSESWVDARNALPGLQDELEAAWARSAGKEKPFAWRYEAATMRVWHNDKPVGWDCWEWKISEFEPNMGEAMRNLTPLYAAPPPSPAGSIWQPILTAPKADRDSTRAISFIGWCPDDTAPDGGDQRIVWWEPRMKKGAGCWWGDRDLEENPTHWKPLGEPPTLPATEQRG